MGQYDILVRHVAHRQAHAFAQALVPETPVRTARWLDTQLTAVRERRADKALELDTGAGPALLKVELAVDPRGSIFFRMFQYSALTLIAQHAARSGATPRPASRYRADAPRDATARGVEEHSAPEPLDAVLLILRGRKSPWPAHGCYRTSPSGAPFSGQHFRIEAVYQRTVDELMARPGSFWLVFTCLAVDANVEKMRMVIDEIRRREPCEQDQSELYWTLLTLAELDPWGHHLHEEIKAMLLSPEMQEVMKTQWVREVVALNREDALEEGLKKGLRRGRKEGRRQGKREGKKEGKQEGKQELIKEMLHHQLVRHLRRELTPTEQQALSARAERLSGPELAEILAQAGSGSLLSWLLGQDAQAQRHAARNDG